MLHPVVILRACESFRHDAWILHLREAARGDSLAIKLERGSGMMRERLFEDLPEEKGAEAGAAAGRPRMREPVRDQIELRAVDIDSLIGEDHAARLIWGYVEQLDLAVLEDAIRAREGRPGHPAITPRLLLALWLYATSQGVGSARALERLCESHDGYRWLLGGVSVNYHTLSDFRVGHGELLDRLLTENIASLAAAGVIDLSTLTQDGIRVRASAGASSFRRRATLEKHLSEAWALIEHLKREIDADADASNRRIRAARQRAARERAARVAAALKVQAEVEAQRERRKRKNRNQAKRQQEPRSSTTDPQARVMKMADGGFRPAFNIQVVSTSEEQIVIGIEPWMVGSDRGLMRPTLEATRERIGCLPARHLGDGGLTAAKDIEWAHNERIEVYCPPTRSKHGSDPFLPKRGDGPGVLAWRGRMASEKGQAQYRRRGIAECIHGRWRQWNLRLTVRGVAKVKAAMLWFALANNILRGHRLATG
jgi:transposase